MVCLYHDIQWLYLRLNACFFYQHKIYEEDCTPYFATHPHPALQVISELVLTPPEDGAANGLEVSNGYGSSAPEARNVYFYCSGLDVSAGGTIDCGITSGTTTAEGATESAQSTPHSTLR